MMGKMKDCFLYFLNLSWFKEISIAIPKLLQVLLCCCHEQTAAAFGGFPNIEKLCFWLFYGLLFLCSLSPLSLLLPVLLLLTVVPVSMGPSPGLMVHFPMLSLLFSLTFIIPSTVLCKALLPALNSAFLHKICSFRCFFCLCWKSN